MGYTHYWRTDDLSECDELIMEEASGVIRKILEKYSDMVQFEEDCEKKPECNNRIVRFNGIGEDGHETFWFDCMSRGFSFCKTARKPYDIVVCEILLVLKSFMPNLVISSDGFGGDEVEEEWVNAIGNVKEYGIHYQVSEDKDKGMFYPEFIRMEAQQ